MTTSASLKRVQEKLVISVIYMKYTLVFGDRLVHSVFAPCTDRNSFQSSEGLALFPL